MRLPQTREDKAHTARVLWREKNRNALAEIAGELSVSRSFVSDVFHGRRRSSDGRVEKLLARAGAPGFTGSAAA